MTGKTPIASRGYMMPGQRISSLCGYDVDGFVCWEHTTGTFDRERFLAAVERTVVRGRPPPRAARPRTRRIHRDAGALSATDGLREDRPQLRLRAEVDGPTSCRARRR